MVFVQSYGNEITRWRF